MDEGLVWLVGGTGGRRVWTVSAVVALMGLTSGPDICSNNVGGAWLEAYQVVVNLQLAFGVANFIWHC